MRQHEREYAIFFYPKTSIISMVDPVTLTCKQAKKKKKKLSSTKSVLILHWRAFLCTSSVTRGHSIWISLKSCQPVRKCISFFNGSYLQSKIYVSFSTLTFNLYETCNMPGNLKLVSTLLKFCMQWHFFPWFTEPAALGENANYHDSTDNLKGKVLQK